MMKIFASFPHGMDASETAQGPYAVARAGFELAILRTEGDESTNEPPRLISAYANGRVYDGRGCNHSTGYGLSRSEHCISSHVAYTPCGLFTEIQDPIFNN